MDSTRSGTDVYRNVRSTRIRRTHILATDSPRQIREKLARIAMDEMYQFVGVLDPAGTLLEANRASLEGAGVRYEDVVGKPFWECFWWAVSEDSRRELRDAIARVARGEFVRYDVEVYGRAQGTETMICDFSMIPVKDDAGAVVFIVPEGRDITEKKAYEREIAEKNRELQALLERIHELDEIKTQFFANVSHELRTPLALILGPAERLLHDAATMSAAEQRSGARIIVRNARMLFKQVDDLLEISKLEAGKLNIRLEVTDLAALVRFVASHFEMLASERRIRFAVETPAACLGAADPGKLQRVLMNLLSNAFKFTPEGGTVRCRLQPAEDEAMLLVDDSGPGVEPELRQTVFERFRQGEGGAERVFSGTGLGLAIAREFVELHKGHIEAGDSDLGGARFLVRLPANRTSTARAEPSAPEQALDRRTLAGALEELRPPVPISRRPSERESGPPGRSKILVVEDNADMNRFVVESLTRDYEVSAVYDGRGGIERALAEQPDLIVCDVMMPNVSGETLLTELRRHPKTHEIPILLLSAKADDELKVRLLEQGAQDFVTKPFHERELKVRVRNLIEAKRGREALRDAERAKLETVEAANRQLRAKSEHLSELFQKTPSFMTVLRGPQHVFELANETFHGIIGRRDILGRPLLEALPELAEQPFTRLLDRVLETGEPYVGTSVRVLLAGSPGGPLEEHYVDFVYQPLRDAGGEISAIFVEGHEVTDRVRAEAALREADRRKDEFLATLAHELRNPLAPIRHAARLLTAGQATPEQLTWSHDVIDRQVQHMVRLLDDLLDVSRITRGRLELRREHMDLKDAVSAAVETAQPLIEAHHHQLVVELPEEPVPVMGDPVRLSQIFSNLLTNAARYTHPGGRIAIGASLEGGNAVIRVADNGIGILPEQMPRLFDMFSQASPAHDRGQAGLGIGLSLVQGLVRLHGGTVEVESAGADQGSEFIVTVPLAPPPAPPESAPEAAADRAAQDPLQVLVADDNRDNADGCSMLLRLAGHEVRTAYSGAEALARVRELRPDVVLLDIGMPDLNGYEVARRIRRLPEGGRITLVAVTGWGQEDDRRRAREAGFDHHLVKPVTLEALRPLLARRGHSADS